MIHVEKPLRKQALRIKNMQNKFKHENSERDDQRSKDQDPHNILGQ